MGKGREIGAQLHAWLAGGDREPLQARRIEGVLLDALGSDPRLRGPVRDLALQPLLLTLLQETSPVARRSLLETLVQDLQATYAPAVLGELLDLLEAATGLPVGRRSSSDGATPLRTPPAAQPAGAPRRRPRRGSTQPWGQRFRDLPADLQPIAPGLALGFANALVFLWLGGELGRLLPRSWSSGLLLLLVLAVLQLLLVRPLARLRRDAPLTLADSSDPHRVWRWITAPWVHHRQGEALLNGLMLLILLGDTPLPLGQLLLRYLLTSLATMLPAVLLARRWLRYACWDGATGAVAALIALATGVSLLQWRPVSFPFGVLTVPVWVLFVVYGVIQLAWVLPRQHPDETAPPRRRLFCSTWWWGTCWGLLWALLTRLQEWAEPLLRGTAAG
jgi:membrane associated rhomboid family serine protease